MNHVMVRRVVEMVAALFLLFVVRLSNFTSSIYQLIGLDESDPDRLIALIVLAIPVVLVSKSIGALFDRIVLTHAKNGNPG